MKRALAIVKYSLFFFIVAVGVARAVVPEVQQYQEAVEYAIGRESVNLEFQSSQTTKQGIAVPLVLGILGGEPQADPTGALNPDGTRKVVYTHGLVGDMGTAIAALYENKPADTRLYVADLLHGAGIAQPAYAQGIGFASLSPVLNTWKTFRNIAYLFFVVIFLVIGFMIMLRQKIGSQTVVTAQQAIPHIIVSLLFVTFSYAIAGLLIDFMYVSMFLILGLFGKASDQFIGMNFIQLGAKMVVSGGSAAYDAVSGFAEQATNSLGEFGSEAVGFLGGLTMTVVVAIAIALNIFRLFFELLKTYVTIVLNIVFAPILLMIGAIPGRNVFGKWVKNLVGNLAAFPAVLLILIVFDELTGGISGGEAVIEGGGFNPPYLFGSSMSGVAGALTFSIGLGALLIMPELVKHVKKVLGAEGGIFEQFAGDIGKSLKRGWTGGELIPGLAMSDTSKWPLGGLSGKNITQKAGEVTAGLAGGGFAAVRRPTRPLSQFSGGFTRNAASAAMLFGDKSMLPREQARIQSQRDAAKKAREAANNASPSGKS